MMVIPHLIPERVILVAVFCTTLPFKELLLSTSV